MSHFGASFGTLVRAKRGELGMTQQALAVAAFGDGARMSRISELETGKVSRPHQRTIALISRALSLTGSEVSACRATQQEPVDPPMPANDDASAILHRIAALFAVENPDRDASDLYEFLSERAEALRTLQTPAPVQSAPETQAEFAFAFRSEARPDEPELDFNATIGAPAAEIAPAEPESLAAVLESLTAISPPSGDSETAEAIGSDDLGEIPDSPPTEAAALSTALFPDQDFLPATASPDGLEAARALADQREARAISALSAGDVPAAMDHYAQAAAYLSKLAPDEARARHLAGWETVLEKLNGKPRNAGDPKHLQAGAFE